MTIKITYTENNELWAIARLAKENGYTKTDDCYWTQIYRNENGDEIVTVREDEDAVNADPVETLKKALANAEETAPRDYSFEYMLLDRLRMDCEYYLGAGQHNDKYLWAGNRHSQIAKMRELYEMIPDKPEWLTPEMINSYEARMKSNT